MARSANAAGVVRGRGWATGLCLLAGLPLFSADNRISLQELGSRTTQDHIPRLVGQRVSVRGVVNASAFHFTDYNLLAIEDQSWGGLLKVVAGDSWLDRFKPGDEIEARGQVAVQYGMPVLIPERIDVLG